MRPKLTRSLLPVLWILGIVTPSSAATDKLNTAARIALGQLRTGRTPAAANAMGGAVTASGELDVFITGDVTRAELEAAGAHVRTALRGVFTASIPLEALEGVEALTGVRSIQGAVVVEPELAFSVPSTNANLQRGPGPAFTGLNGAGVIL